MKPLSYDDLAEHFVEGLLKAEDHHHDHIHLANAKPVTGEKELSDIITRMITDQLETARQAIINGAEESYELNLARYNFFESIDKDLNKILYKTADNVDEHIENLYEKGKAEGFKLMEVKSYFGPADKQALFNLKNYNFDLIKSIDTGLRNNIRTEVWRGVARGDSIPQIASRIKELNLEPIPAGNRMMSPEERAKSIARTETMRARNTGTKMSLKNYGVTMVEIPESGTEGDWDCECPDLVEGSPYPIDEVPDLPAHPNCYDKDTEVYTSNGWKLFKDVSDDDLILTMNPITFEIEFVDFINKIEYEYNGNMVYIYNKWFDMMVTPDHHMFVLRRDRNPKHKNKYKHSFEKASELRGEYNIPRTAKWNPNPEEIINISGVKFKSSEFAYFMGWWLSEGHIERNRPNRIGITQWDEKTLNTIYLNVQEMLGNEVKVHLCSSYIAFHHKELYNYLKQFGKSHEKFIPNEIKSLPLKYLKIFLEAYLKGDGSFRLQESKFKEINSKEKVFFTSSHRMASDLSELILKCGGYPSISVQNTEGKEITFKNGTYKINHDMYRISWNRSKMAYSSKLKVEQVQYNNMVYCLELEKHHILWVKRNNKTAFSGNCTHTYAPASEPFAEPVDVPADEIVDLTENS